MLIDQAASNKPVRCRPSVRTILPRTARTTAEARNPVINMTVEMEKKCRAAPASHQHRRPKNQARRRFGYLRIATSAAQALVAAEQATIIAIARFPPARATG